MKHLKIEYTTDSGRVVVLFDDPVAEMSWTDVAGGVRVEGKLQDATAAPSSGVSNLLNLITGASKARAEALAEEKKSELAVDKVQTIDSEEVSEAAV